MKNLFENESIDSIICVFSVSGFCQIAQTLRYRENCRFSVYYTFERILRIAIRQSRAAGTSPFMGYFFVSKNMLSFSCFLIRKWWIFCHLCFRICGVNSFQKKSFFSDVTETNRYFSMFLRTCEKHFDSPEKTVFLERIDWESKQMNFLFNFLLAILFTVVVSPVWENTYLFDTVSAGICLIVIHTLRESQNVQSKTSFIVVTTHLPL